jgi:hypothetical protein
LTIVDYFRGLLMYMRNAFASVEPIFSYVSVSYKGFVHCNSFIIIVSMC